MLEKFSAGLDPTPIAEPIAEPIIMPEAQKGGSSGISAEKKSGFFKDIGTFFAGLSGSINESNNEVKGFVKKKGKWSVAGLMKKKPSGPPYRHCDDYAWAKNVIVWSNIDLVVIIIMTAIVWYGVYAVYNRPIYNVKADQSLDVKLKSFRSIPTLDQDMMVVWLVNVIQMLEQVSPNGKPFLPGIVAQVHPVIYDRTMKAYNKIAKEVSDTMSVYNTIITKIAKIYVNEEDKRVTVYFQGFITRAVINPQTIEGKTQADRVIIPYRAKALISQGPPSKLNPTGFFLIELTEKFGQDGIKWFKELDFKGTPSVVEAPKPVK
jgi:hypothetical protein